MTAPEDLRAQHEAKSRTELGRSAARARMWAGLNRYLAAEAEHEQQAAAAEHEPGARPASRPDGDRG